MLPNNIWGFLSWFHTLSWIPLHVVGVSVNTPIWWWRKGAIDMATLAAEFRLPTSDPLDAVERVMAASRLSFERMGTEDIAGSFTGGWCDYRLWFAYRGDLDVLHFASGFDMRVPEHRRRAIHPLLSLINERLWIGHFDLWTEEGQPTWRHALLLRGTLGVEDPQISDLVSLGVGECERFYPAFQQVIWADQEPEEALAAALIEPRGTA